MHTRVSERWSSPGLSPRSNDSPVRKHAVRATKEAGLKSLLLILLPFVIYVACVALIGDWIMDDAGISFAYARNFAYGHGFVSQPGRETVEGFSNFLWVLLYVPFFWIHFFDPIWLPKGIAALLVLASLGMVHVVLMRTGRPWVGWLAALFIAMAPPIVIWTASGLENSLLLLLVVSMWTVTTLRPKRWAVAGGMLAALIAMTRPDGILYAIVVPLISTLELAEKRSKLREAVLNVLRGMGAFALVWGPFLAFRILRFGLPFPHTYYAKIEYASQGERLNALLVNHGHEIREKIWGLGQGIAGPIGPWLLAASLAAALMLLWKHRMPRQVVTAFILLTVAFGAYLWLPNDWMGEFRFATPAIAMAWIFTFTLAGQTLDCMHLEGAWRKVAPTAFALILAAAVAPGCFSRLIRFSGNPPTSYRLVERQYALRFNAYADALGVTNGSILIADIGAMLMESNLTVYDAAGLCEPAVVRTLRKGTPIWQRDHPEFYQWIFEEIRPTFVVTYAFWTLVTALEYDPRFKRDYVAIESGPDEYVKAVYHRDVHSGQFVRRDALKTPDALEAMRRSYVSPPELDRLVFRIGERLRSWFVKGTLSADDLRQGEIVEPPTKEYMTNEPHDEVGLYQWALKVLAAGRMDDARRALEQTITLNPRHASAYFWLGTIAGKEQRLDDALFAYQQCLQIDPAFADADNNLGFTLGLLGRYSEAVPVLEEALKLRPDYTLARANLNWVKSELEHGGDKPRGKRK